MAKILYEINYKIYPEKRADYLEAISDLKELVPAELNYQVFENAKNSNDFTEIFMCESEDEYENFEDNQDDKVREITEKLINELVIDKKISFTTKNEL
ncbi:hypothetical protein D4R20_03280 [bacterium]|nr:MAG: hypothetical protein D4R20_03280 [bacterium]